MNRIKKWYYSKNPPTVNTEGIWYDRKKGVFEVYYYPSNLEKTRLIGEYNNLKDAKFAQKVYTQAMNDIQTIIKTEA